MKFKENKNYLESVEDIGKASFNEEFLAKILTFWAFRYCYYCFPPNFVILIIVVQYFLIFLGKMTKFNFNMRLYLPIHF